MNEDQRLRRYRKRLTQVFGRELAPSDGVNVQRLATAEQRLGFALPSAVSDFYRLAGAAKEARARNRLVEPEELVVEDGRRCCAAIPFAYLQGAEGRKPSSLSRGSDSRQRAAWDFARY